jgi:hypothetical protein
MVSFQNLTKYIYHRIELIGVAQTRFFCKDIFDFHINRLIVTSVVIFQPMSRNCSCMYKLSSSAHLIKDLSFKFCNLSIGLDKSSTFQYTRQNKTDEKSSNIKKHVLIFFEQVVIRNSQSFPKHFIVKAPCYISPTFQFMQCIFPYFQVTNIIQITTQYFKA